MTNSNGTLIANHARLSEEEIKTNKLVYVSIPMEGYSDKVILGWQTELMNWYRVNYDFYCNTNITCNLITSIFHEKNPHMELSRAIKVMRYANVIIFADGWEQDPRCQIERLVAENYNKELGTVIVE